MPDYSLNWIASPSAIQGVKGVNNAARPLESSPAQPKPGSLSASSLPLSIDSPVRGWNVYICLFLPPDRTWYKVNDPKVDYSVG